MADDRTKYNNFELLVGRHRGLIRKLCWWRLSGNESLCDDLVQECYLAMWQHFDSLRPDVAKLQEAAWVVWQCRSVFSHSDRETTLPTADERLFDHLSAPDVNETREILDDLAQALTPDEQLSAIARYVDTAFMTTYVYVEPPIDTGNVSILVPEEGNAIVAYPNPFHQKVTIQCNEAITAAYITDMMGRRDEVRLLAEGNGCYNLDLNARPQSTYLLTVITADGKLHTVRLLNE